AGLDDPGLHRLERPGRRPEVEGDGPLGVTEGDERRIEGDLDTGLALSPHDEAARDDEEEEEGEDDLPGAEHLTASYTGDPAASNFERRRIAAPTLPAARFTRARRRRARLRRRPARSAAPRSRRSRSRAARCRPGPVPTSPPGGRTEAA